MQPCAMFVVFYLILKDKRKETNETQMKTIHEMINGLQELIFIGVP